MQSLTIPTFERSGDARLEQRNALYGVLLADAKRGDMAAFEQLYDETARWLLALVRRFVRDDQAEDVLAESYLQVWRTLDAYDPTRADPMVWLAMIVRSRARDHLRREKARGADLTDSDHAAPEQSTAETPEGLATLAQERRLLLCFLQGPQLNADERAVLGLYLAENTAQEISCATGLSLRGVRVAMVRAQEKLRAHMGAGRRDARRPQAAQPQP